MTIPVFDLGAENAAIKDRFFARLGELYDTSRFVAGYEDGPVEELERALAGHCGRAHAVGAGSGTLALEMAALALELKPGDEVIVPVNTFVATASAAARRGATIVGADVDPETWNLSRATVEKLVTSRTKAIFAVNLYGNPAPYDELCSLGVPVIEDAAHSHGAVYRAHPGAPARRSGGLGTVSTFSFFPSKVLGGIGDGGMILLDDERLYAQLRTYRNCGQSKKHYATMLGSVSRMDVIQAAFLLEKWSILPRLLEHRRAIAAVYDGLFAGTAVGTQKIEPGCESAYFVYVVRVRNRERVRARLEEAGVSCSIQYPYLLHQQPFWNCVAARKDATPVAEALVGEILSIPMNAGLTASKAELVAGEILRCAQ